MNRTVVAITGASSGIGEAFARKLAPGHNLLLIARRKDRLESLAEEFSNKFGTQTEILQADLTNDDDLNAAADRLESQRGLCLLVNNAGFGIKGRFWEADLAGQERMHKLHIGATVRLTYSALRNMVLHDFGAIVNVASVSSFIRSPGSTSYSATKAWMTAFTEGLYIDLRQIHSTVAVQALCPGFTYSEFHDAMGAERYKIAGPGWWLTAEEVVDASIDGLKRRKLFVVPGWRYKVLVTAFNRLPLRLRAAFELAAVRAKPRQIPINVDSRRQIESDS